MIRLGNTIKRLRKAKNLTLTDIARLSGIQLATLSRIENNKMVGSLSCHLELSKALGMKLSEFFDEYEKDRMNANNVERNFLLSAVSRSLN